MYKLWGKLFIKPAKATIKKAAASINNAEIQGLRLATIQLPKPFTKA